MSPPPPSTTPSSATTGTSSMSVTAAAALGVGGMMGAGLYTLVGLAATTAGVWIPVAFVIGGFVATLSVYSYAKLGAVFPSRGGAAQFLVRCFGDGVVAGGLNVFQFLGWIVAMALYAAGFAGYARELLPWETPSWVGKVIGVGIVLVVVVVNLVGSKLVGGSEQVVIVVEIVILALFVVLGLFKADVGHFSASGGDGVMGVLFAAGVLYICYEGFGVVTNSADEMAYPARELPRAMYLAVGIVVAVYVIVSATIVMVLTLPQIEANAGHVLADAAKEVAGRAGFIALGVAALLATSSAVNATMFGTANLAFMVAKDGELPARFDRKVWLGGTGSLFVAAAVTMLFVVAFPLESVGQMASLAFLIVYGTVSLGHLRVRHRTGAKAWILWAAVLLNAGLFVLLFVHAVQTGPATTWITLIAMLVLSFVFETVYRRATGRTLKLEQPPDAAPAATAS